MFHFSLHYRIPGYKHYLGVIVFGIHSRCKIFVQTTIVLTEEKSTTYIRGRGREKKKKHNRVHTTAYVQSQGKQIGHLRAIGM